MYLSLLFDQQDQLMAAAPACDQQPMGDRYWHECYPQKLANNLGETAVIDIKSAELVELLLGLVQTPENLELCRARFAAYEKKQSLHRRSHAA